MPVVNPIAIGSADDVYQYLGNVEIDGSLKMTSAKASSNIATLFTINGTNGPILSVKTKMATVTTTAAATATFTDFIPAKSVIWNINFYNVTAVSGSSVTSYKAGDGTDDDVFGATIPLTAGAAYSAFTGTMAAGVYPNVAATAKSVVLTQVGGSAFAAGCIVRAQMCYVQFENATS